MSMFIYIIENMNKKYSKIPCFVEMKIKTTNQICGISKQNTWFSTKKFVQLFLFFPKLCV